MTACMSLVACFVGLYSIFFTKMGTLSGLRWSLATSLASLAVIVVEMLTKQTPNVTTVLIWSFTTVVYSLNTYSNAHMVQAVNEYNKRKRRLDEWYKKNSK